MSETGQCLLPELSERGWFGEGVIAIEGVNGTRYALQEHDPRRGVWSARRIGPNPTAGAGDGFERGYRAGRADGEGAVSGMCDHEWDGGECCDNRPWRRCWKCDAGGQQVGSPVPCDWCGKAIRRYGFIWLAVKGLERGYDPYVCESSEAGTHDRWTDREREFVAEGLRRLGR